MERDSRGVVDDALTKHREKMRIIIDIGNTNIVTGCAEEGKILFCERLSTNHRATTLEYMTVFRTAFELYGIDKEKIDGAVISAVDLIKGIGLCAGMRSIDVPGATGNVHTNYDGKAKAAIEAFESGVEFVYVHVEGPDECGHRQDRPMS